MLPQGLEFSVMLVQYMQAFVSKVLGCISRCQKSQIFQMFKHSLLDCSQVTIWNNDT